MIHPLIARTAAHLEALFSGAEGSHDWQHVRRVWQTSRVLAQTQPAADPVLTELAALLHDIADWKYHGGDDEAGPRAARVWLTELALDPAQIARVEQIIREVTFKGLGVSTPVSSVEAALVQDADRLDAIGAIGIARAFAYGGSRGRALHTPEQPPADHPSFAAYQAATGSTIHHFHEKLLHLAERLHTPAARQIARHRHQVMEAFLAQFEREWTGVDVAETVAGAA